MCSSPPPPSSDDSFLALLLLLPPRLLLMITIWTFIPLFFTVYCSGIVCVCGAQLLKKEGRGVGRGWSEGRWYNMQYTSRKERERERVGVASCNCAKEEEVEGGVGWVGLGLKRARDYMLQQDGMNFFFFIRYKEEEKEEEEMLCVYAWVTPQGTTLRVEGGGRRLLMR